MMFSRRTTSTTVSRATSFSDSASLDMERTSSTVQALTLNNSGRRTMCLEEEDEDDKFETPWDKLKATGGPTSSVSDSRPDESIDVPTNPDVTVLRISNLIKGCTTSQLYQAFGATKEEMRIEVQGNDDALLHFEDATRALKAYFDYLGSTSSLGSVEPYDPAAESLSTSPLKSSGSVLRNRRSFQIGNGSNTMLSALSNISSWRSSDKLQTMNTNSAEKEPRLGHRSNSSKSSTHSKSTERMPGVQRHATSPTLTMSPLTPEFANDEKPLTMRATPTKVQNSQAQPAVAPPLMKEQAPEMRPTVKKTSTARRIISGGFSFKSKGNKEKTEKSTKASTSPSNEKQINGKSKT